MHQYWTEQSKDMIVSKFNSTFCAFLTMEHELDSLHELGVEGVDMGPFGRCPVCASGPERKCEDWLSDSGDKVERILLMNDYLLGCS